MRWSAVLLAALGMFVSLNAAGAAKGREEIEQFNRRYLELHQKTDTQGIFALWEEDGVSLMPRAEPLRGRKAIEAHVEEIMAGMPGYKVTKQEMEFFDIEVSGDWASEWALEHQVVQPPEGKEPIETWGQFALVLHRGADGQWRVKQEMWSPAPKR